MTSAFSARSLPLKGDVCASKFIHSVKRFLRFNVDKRLKYVRCPIFSHPLAGDAVT